MFTTYPSFRARSTCRRRTQRGISHERLPARGEDVADDACRAARPRTALPRDLGERRHVRHEVLVALRDPREPLDRRPVEPGAVLDRPTKLVDRDRHGLDRADDVGELELHEADTAFLRIRDERLRITVLAGARAGSGARPGFDQGRHATPPSTGTAARGTWAAARGRRRPASRARRPRSAARSGPGSPCRTNDLRLGLDRPGLVGRVLRMLEGVDRVDERVRQAGDALGDRDDPLGRPGAPASSPR